MRAHAQSSMSSLRHTTSHHNRFLFRLLIMSTFMIHFACASSSKHPSSISRHLLSSNNNATNSLSSLHQSSTPWRRKSLLVTPKLTGQNPSYSTPGMTDSFNAHSIKTGTGSHSDPKFMMSPIPIFNSPVVPHPHTPELHASFGLKSGGSECGKACRPKHLNQELVTPSDWAGNLPSTTTSNGLTNMDSFRSSKHDSTPSQQQLPLYTPQSLPQRMLDTPQSPNWQLQASFGVKSETVRTEIASGGFATVYAESRDDGQRVAVKEQTVKTEEERQKIRYEFRMQEKVNRLDTNGTCTVKAVALHEWDTAMLMELEYGGKAVKVDDGKFNDELDLSPTDPQMICQFITQIGSVLQLVNERGNMLVQDVKLENVLYDGQNFKLIDFGEAIDFNDPPNTVQFEVTPMITTSLQIWLLNMLGEDLYYHSYERVRNEPLFALLRQTPSLVDMQALVISVLDFILRPMKNDERFYVQQSRVGMQNLYRIPQIVANKQQILGEIQQKFVQRPAFAAQLFAFLDAYWPEYVPYLPNADGSVVQAAFARSVAKFGDWRKFMVHAQRMCMAA